MVVIPISPLPSQILKIVLNNQNCQLFIYQKQQGLFVDLNSNDSDIQLCAIALESTPIISIKYTGFIGNFVFIDTQGNSNPYYDQLGTRFVLIYDEQL